MDIKTKKRWYWCLASVFMIMLLDLVFPPPLEIPYSKLVLDKEGNILSAYLASDDRWRFRTRPTDVNQELQKILLYKEDKYFYYHIGVNPVAIIRALFQNAISGERISGASTITMQVARLLEPKPRTYFSKIQEVLRAFQLEWRLSKVEILSLYLDKLPYGGNIEGIRAASWRYFGQEAAGLSPARLVTLSIIPNRPESWRPGVQNEALRIARNRWLTKLYADEYLNTHELNTALNEPLDAYLRPLPKFAPQFCRLITLTEPHSETYHTTLSLDLQKTTQTIIKNHIQRIKPLGISNAAALVVDNESRSILAYVGSADFEDEQSLGQNDGIQAVRSPGSTLKPLVYGMAFEKGILTPALILPDIPTHFHGYTPENYDKKFHGLISTEFALINSLNIPAVSVLEKVGVKSVISRLQTAGFSHLEPNKLGLSMILGGCGATLEQLVGLYCALANGGRFETLNKTYEQLNKSKQPNIILTESASWLVSDILSKLKRPDLPHNYEQTLSLPKICWKTGTSFSNRDAWAIGYNKHVTIGVWVGNFNGESSPSINGSEVATPLLTQLFVALDKQGVQQWLNKPNDIQQRKVCSKTGLPPAHSCVNQTTDYFINGVTALPYCEHLKSFSLDPSQKFRFCPFCQQPPSISVEFDNYPPEVEDYFIANRIPFNPPPPHNPNCKHQTLSQKTLTIVSPVNGGEYFIKSTNPGKLSLRCFATRGAKKVYWFKDDRFLKEVPVGEEYFWRPDSGLIKISVTDDVGGKASVKIRVKFIP